ncbi:outer-membrane immunogenic protein [Nocardiopsis salina]|uniref:outer-membrane immunogenic protein n=1 Tax=Nocardiopsis salina TaxID=245836 RepID=UPI000346BA0B|nr:outer-membrane immunogenic protein [Nocardiopsis salina]
MSRIAKVSGFVLATGLAFGAFSGTAAADNNADVQNITVPVCLDVLAASGASSEGCNVVDINDTDGISVHD